MILRGKLGASFIAVGNLKDPQEESRLLLRKIVHDRGGNMGEDTSAILNTKSVHGTEKVMRACLPCHHSSDLG